MSSFFTRKKKAEGNTVSLSPEELNTQLQKALAEAEARAEQERLGREQAEREREHAEREREQAEREREQERLGREQERIAREQAEKGREKAEVRADKAEETIAAQNALAQVNAHDYLSRPLNPAVQTSNPPPGSKTTANKRETIEHVAPFQVAQWTDFDLDGFKRFTQNKMIKNPNIVESTDLWLNDEKMFDVCFKDARTSIKMTLDGLFPGLGYSNIGFTSTEKSGSGAGSTDAIAKVGVDGPTLFVAEYKAITVEFETAMPIWKLYEQAQLGQRPEDQVTKFRNTLNTLIQTYSYMCSKKPEEGSGSLQYGFASNWNHWVFFKRTVASSKEVLLATPWFRFDQDARFAIALFLRTTFEAGGELVGFGIPGEMPTIVGQLEEKYQEEKQAKRQNMRLSRAADGSAWERSGQPSVPSDQGATAKEALGVYLFALPCKTLSYSDKSVTKRGMVNGRDLVWKTVDFHGTPKHTDWTYEDLESMMENEVDVYDRLKVLQGKSIPEFVFRGSDLNFLWVVVTTYEGQSLESLDKINDDVKRKARLALGNLHEHGVLHGDVALRNAVLREGDGAVLWVGLEMAKVVGKNVSPDDFHVMAEDEFRQLEACFNEAEKNIP